jgi:hypothetical protein
MPTNSRRSEGKELGEGRIPKPNQTQASKQQPQTQRGRRNQEQPKAIQNQKKDGKNVDHPAQRTIITSTSEILPKEEAATRNRCPKTTSGTPKSDQKMKEAFELSILPGSKTKSCVELLEEGRQKLEAIGNSTPDFGIQESTRSPAPGPAAQSNPFAILGDDNVGAASLMEAQEDLKEGWSFQGRKRLDPKQTPPRPSTQHISPHPSHKELTPSGKRGLMHSEMHPSYFTSLGIQVLPSKEPLRARIWPILTMVKEGAKETLVHSKNQDPPSLPLCFRITGPTEAAKTEWTQDSARTNLIQRLELELEENILRFKWCTREQLHLEWSWQEEKRRGGMDCTILAHIETETSALSTKNKQHLHWKVLDPAQEMNNDIDFMTPAHNLLRKTDSGNSVRQSHRNNTASLLASS